MSKLISPGDLVEHIRIFGLLPMANSFWLVMDVKHSQAHADGPYVYLKCLTPHLDMFFGAIDGISEISLSNTYCNIRDKKWIVHKSSRNKL